MSEYQINENDISRFWSKVDQREQDECWPWKNSIGTWGYGSFWLDGANHNASRIAYQMAYGFIPDGPSVLHECDNPPCCNPDHLFLGTQGDNVRDCAHKGRGRGQFKPGKLNQRHNRKLTDDEVCEAKRLYETGIGPSELGLMFRLHSSTMSRVVNQVTFKHL